MVFGLDALILFAQNFLLFPPMQETFKVTCFFVYDCLPGECKQQKYTSIISGKN